MPARATLRAEVQALRAVAVLLVVLYHLWPGRLPGGYVGVDVFFVISGFLITGQIVREVDATGRLRLGRFWARRARRLLPAAYLVLASSAVAVYLWVPQIHWQQNFREIIGSGLYVQNWLLSADAVDYLAAENLPSTAQHYWTLSVEEQFYFGWPLLILLAAGLAALARRRQRRTALLLVLGVATAASLAYSLWLTGSNPSSAYFITPSRVWEFGAGGLLALAPARGPGRNALRAALSWLGFLALAWCGLAYSASTAFPGTAALLPVLATVLIIAVGAPGGVCSPMLFLGVRAAQKLGDISYALYLWHWPLIVVVPFVLRHPMGFAPRLWILLAAIALAALTKRFVEDPIRFGRRFGFRRSGVTFAFSLAAAAVLVSGSLAGMAVAAQAGERAAAVTEQLNTEAPACLGAASMDTAPRCHNPALDGVLVPDTTAVRDDFAFYPGCWSGNVESNLNDCTFGDRSDPRLPHVVLVGDSHARAVLPVFVRLAAEGKLTVSAQLKGSCSWSTNPQRFPVKKIDEACPRWRAAVQSWLLAHSDSIDLLVTTTMAKIQDGTPAARVHGFVEAWKPFADRGIPILALKDNPYHFEDTNDCLAAERVITTHSCALPRSKAFPFFDALPAAVEATPHAVLLDFTDRYCTRTRCPAVIGGVNVYRDKHHVTATYSKTLTPYWYAFMTRHHLLTVRPRG